MVSSLWSTVEAGVQSEHTISQLAGFSRKTLCTVHACCRGDHGDKKGKAAFWSNGELWTYAGRAVNTSKSQISNKLTELLIL